MDPNSTHSVTPPSTVQNQAGMPTARAGMAPARKRVLLGVIGVIIILLLLLFGISRSQNNKPQIDQLVSEAQQAFTKGDFPTAEQKGKAGLALDKKNKALLLTEINSLASEGNATGKGRQALSDAQAYIDEALRDYPNDAGILSAIGYAYEVAGQYDKALMYYQKALTADPNNANIVFQIGHIYEQQGKQKDAFAQYDKAYALDPKDPGVLMGKAREALFQNNIDQALSFYKTVTDLPNMMPVVKAESFGAQAQIKEQQLLYPEDALSLAKKAVDADANFAPGVATYGYELALHTSAKDGLIELDKAIALDPSVSGFYWQKGIVDRAVKRYNAAQADFIQAIDAVANDATLLGVENKNNAKGQYYYDYAKTFVMANIPNKTDKVIGWIKEAISLNPNVKQYAKFDYQSSVFNNYKSDPQFQQYMQTL